MAATAWKVHDKVLQKFLNGGGIDLDTDALVMRLYDATSDVDTPANEDASAATDEVAAGNGYATGGVALAGVTINEAAGVVTFDANNVVWTAAGGSIAARKAAIIDTSATPDEIICTSLLDPSVDIVATDTNTFTVSPHADGIFTLTSS